MIEGWCLGIRGLEDDSVIQDYDGFTKDEIKQINSIFFEPEIFFELEKLFTYFDIFIRLKPTSMDFVEEWRWEQECKLKKEKGVGMSKQEVLEFVARFMPIYHYYNAQLDEGFFKSEAGKYLEIVIDKSRSVVRHRII